jgi:hypothetical protein
MGNTNGGMHMSIRTKVIGFFKEKSPDALVLMKRERIHDSGERFEVEVQGGTSFMETYHDGMVFRLTGSVGKSKFYDVFVRR